MTTEMQKLPEEQPKDKKHVQADNGSNGHANWDIRVSVAGHRASMSSADLDIEFGDADDRQLLAAVERVMEANGNKQTLRNMVVTRVAETNTVLITGEAQYG